MAKKIEKSTDLASTLSRLEATYGKGSVFKMNDDNALEEYDVISSGSIGFDYKVLGTGGFVKGKVYELMGWEGVGKSTICGHLTANCQALGGSALYIDGEHAVDRNYFTKLGVDMKTLLIAQPSNGEEGFNIASDLIKSDELDLIIIDSDNSLLPISVIEGDIGDSAIGKKARLNNSSYPKLKSLASKHNVCLVVISQYREKIGVMFGDPKTTQGGHALKFYSDCRIEMSKSLKKDGDAVIANVTKVRTIKNKMFAPYRKTEFDVLYGKGIDKITEIVDLMHLYELGKKRAGVLTVDEMKYPIDELEGIFETNPELYISWVNKLKNILKEANDTDE